LKRLRRRLAAAALAAAGWTGAQAEPYRFPVYREAAQVAADCDRLLADLQARQAALEDSKPASVAVLLDGFDAVTRRVEEVFGPMELMIPVHPDKAVRDAAEACSLKQRAFAAAFQQSEKLHALLAQAAPADAVEARYRQDLLDAFEDAGVALPPPQRARAQALSNEISQAAQTFSRRVREDKTRVPFSEAELRGVPGAVWKDAPRDAHGRYLLGLDYPTSVPLLQSALSEPARERMWRATQQKGGADNLPTLARITELRREYARLFGFDSYADFILRRRMARRETEVRAFLDSVKAAVASRERSDIALLRAAKAKQQKTALSRTTLHRWDVAFYTERARQARYAVEQEQFRRYFPPEASLAFVFRVATRLFGVDFAPVDEPLWHADARAFELKDAASGRELGTLFVDLFPRPDKYGHAAVWSFRNASTSAGVQPAAGLVVNFDRRGLTLSELEVLLHEFGHALHSLLSTTRYADQGGTSVQRDFVEAPSQMLEDWVYDPQVIALFRDVCAECKPVPPALLARAKRAKEFAKGIYFARQHLYASYDLALYGREPRDPLRQWAAMEGATPLGHVPGSMFPASFDHIAGGYAAGYYGYLWSLVLAEDLRTAFAADKLDAAVGARYRSAILARGAEVLPAQMMQDFLGRPSDSKAFFKALDRR
jgi:thimet oligopeptidase